MGPVTLHSGGPLSLVAVLHAPGVGNWMLEHSMNIGNVCITPIYKNQQYNLHKYILLKLIMSPVTTHAYGSGAFCLRPLKFISLPARIMINITQLIRLILMPQTQLGPVGNILGMEVEGTTPAIPACAGVVQALLVTTLTMLLFLVAIHLSMEKCKQC